MRNPIRNTDLNRLGRVLDAHAAGHFTLPAGVTRAQTALARLQAVDDVVIPNAHAARWQLIDATVAAAEAGRGLPAVAAVAKMRAAAAEAELRRDVLVEAMTAAENALVSAIRSTAETTITAHAAPALDKVMTQAKHAARLAEGDGDRADLLRSSPASIDAWRKLEELSQRYVALREVRTALGTGVTHDVDGLFTEFRAGLRVVWPNARAMGAGSPPWPDAPAARLRWLATCGHEVWLPTDAQRDQAWLDTYGHPTQQAVPRELIANQ